MAKRIVRGITTLFVVLLLASGAVHLFSEDLAGALTDRPVKEDLMERGEKLYARKGCPQCHGKAGANPPDAIYPKVNDQPPRYIATQIRDILSGRRDNGTSPVMQEAVESLSEAEIEAIALYLSEAP